MEVTYSNEQFFLIWNFVIWIVITYFNFEDIRELIPNKFNAIIHICITAPLFMQLISNAYLNSLVQGYMFASAILFTSIYIVALKYIMSIKIETEEEEDEKK